MLCCLNPDCPKPLNPDGNQSCLTCFTPLIPLLRGHYRVIEPLSTQGGFGRTYLAEDIDKLNERCIVKQLAPNVQGTWALKKAIDLFQEEAKRLQELGQHNQIPRLLAYFEQDNYLYLVQQFINGHNLQQELQQRGKYSEREIQEILLDLLPVLKFIHQHGVIHRDIKPQNIMRRFPEGDLVLIDFGASKQLTETVHTQVGTAIGSHGYTAIEQMQDGEAYPASDLFSLGTTCFHLLTEIRPSQLWMRQGYGWVTSWQQHLKSPLSHQLSQVIDKLLKIDIHERYQSADEVIQNLTSPEVPPTVVKALPKKQLQVIPDTEHTTVLEGVEKPQQVIPKTDNKLKKALLLGFGIVLLGLGGTWYLQSRPSATTESSKPNQTTISNSENPVLSITLNGHSSDVNSVAFAPNGQILASGSDDNTIKLWNLATRAEIRTLKGHSNHIYSVAFAPDSKTLASGSEDKTIKLWNVETGKEIRTLTGHSNWVNSVAFSHDGKMLASGSVDKTIKLWNVETGKEIRTLTGHSQGVQSVAFSPDDTTLASGSLDKTIKLWNPIAGATRTLAGHSNFVMSVAFSPDGKTLASGSWDKTIKLWNVQIGKEIRTLNQHSDKVNSVVYIPSTGSGKSPDENILASGSNDNTIKLWNLATGQEIKTLKGDSGYVYSVAISPNAQTLASGGTAGNTLKLWQMSH